MCLFSVSSHARCWLLAAACLLLELASAPAVLASCGDWLAEPGEAAATTAAAEPPHATLPPPLGAEPAARQAGCRGPWCRQAPSPGPAETPPARIAPVHRADACAAVAEAAAEPGIERQLPLCEPAFLPPGFVSRIEHPPRA
jgi:hypothetical protein